MDSIATRNGGTDVAQYNPDQGLKTIAVAEAAEKHWRRAKNSDKLFEAVKQKLIEQARYVVWRDGVVKHGGDRKSKNQGPRTATLILPDDDPGKRVVERWRKRLCSKVGSLTIIDREKIVKEAKRIETIIDDGKFALALEEAHLRCQRVCEDEPKGTERGTAGTGEFERYTPAQYIEAARKVLGTIDLDPASNPQAQQTVKAEAYFTAEDDGLKRMWPGNVWLNPPYHRELQPLFVDKLVEEVKAGRTTQAIMLTNNSTDTEWFQKAAHASDAIAFTYGRIAFTTPGGQTVAPTQGQAFFYFGKSVDAFADVFRDIGFGVTVAWKYVG